MEQGSCVNIVLHDVSETDLQEKIFPALARVGKWKRLSEDELKAQKKFIEYPIDELLTGHCSFKIRVVDLGKMKGLGHVVIW